MHVLSMESAVPQQAYVIRNETGHRTDAIPGRWLLLSGLREGGRVNLTRARCPRSFPVFLPSTTMIGSSNRERRRRLIAAQNAVHEKTLELLNEKAKKTSSFQSPPLRYRISLLRLWRLRVGQDALSFAESSLSRCVRYPDTNFLPLRRAQSFSCTRSQLIP